MKAQKIIITALFAALVFVATYFLRIPTPIGYFNFGDVFLLLSVFFLNPISSGICGAIGGAVADLASGFAVYAPFTLAIKFIQGIVAGILFGVAKRREKTYFLGIILAFVVSVLLMAVGYLAANSILYSFQTAVVAVLNDLIQAGVALFSATVLSIVLSHISYLRHAFGLRPLFEKNKEKKDE